LQRRRQRLLAGVISIGLGFATAVSITLHARPGFA
jgi:hypothetical protein